MARHRDDLWKLHQYCFLAFITLLLLLSSTQAIAAVRPSFILDDCAWHSTDIVVATEGEQIDGNLTVLEVWKGDMKPGEAISIPELAAFAPVAQRTVEPEYRSKSPNAPTFVSGSRMILFLKKPATGRGPWQPASFFGEMDTSVIWIEQGTVYAVFPEDGFGPAQIVPFPLFTRKGIKEWTEQGMEEAVLSITGAQDLRTVFRL